MLTGIDWLSFTIPSFLNGADDSLDAYKLCIGTLSNFGLWKLMEELERVPFSHHPGRFAYAVRLYYESIHINIHYGGHASHILVEIAGAGCEWLRGLGLLEETAVLVEERATRVDVACDFLNIAKPSDFTSAGYNRSFDGRASIESSTGATEYVGSMKAERFARVYMYAPPHPRAGVLRVEHVLKHQYAKQALGVLRLEGLSELVGRVGLSFGWKHEAWQQAAQGKLKSSRAAYDGAGSLRWVRTAVIPAVVRLHREGLLDLAQFISELEQETRKGVTNHRK